jgi:hypothetical protein
MIWLWERAEDEVQWSQQKKRTARSDCAAFAVLTLLLSL